VRIYTNEIINAICLNMAERRGVNPTDVEVQLSWEEEYGYTAEVWVKGRSQFIIEANILEAIEQYIYKQYNLRVFRSNITLDADEEFWADITE
jgi:hypothetical protein